MSFEVDVITEQLIRLEAAWHEFSLGQSRTRGLPAAQCRTLSLLDLDGGMTIGAVAKSNALSQSATTELIDQMVKAGLVFRLQNPSNRRQWLVELTPTGELLASDIHEEWRACAERFLASEQRLENLIAVLPDRA